VTRCRKQNHFRIFVIISLLTVAYLLALATNITPYLRGPDSWRWAYAIPGVPSRHWVPAVVVAIYCLIAVLWLRPTRKRDRKLDGLFLGFIVLCVPLIQGALLYPDAPDIFRPLFYRTVSAGASGVFSVGSTISNLADFLQRYPTLMPTFPVHPQRYPPGLSVMFFGVRKLLSLLPTWSDRLGLALRLYQCQDAALMELSNATIASAAIQMALPVISSLVVVPLYYLTKWIAGRQSALWAAAAYPLVPSFAMWSARWDQFYPLLTCTVFLLYWHALTGSKLHRRRCILEMFVSGVLLALSVFLSFGPLALLVPMAFSALLWVLPQRQHWQWKRLLEGVLAFITGFVLPWLFYQGLFGSGFLDIWQVSMRYHLGLRREYGVWLFYHLWDFFTFLGIPLALLLLIGMYYAVRKVKTDPRASLPFGFGLGLLFLDFSGTSRGEVARVWLFLTPLAVIGAVYGLSQLQRKVRQHAWILALLAVQLLVFNAFLRVVTTGITDPPMLERASSFPSDALSIQARFGDKINLVGYVVEPVDVYPGSQLKVRLTWQSLVQLSRFYTVFVHLHGQDGHIITQHDGIPQAGQAPVTCWIPGYLIPDEHILVIPDDVVPGIYTLTAGLYHLPTGERLVAEGKAAVPDGSAVLTTIRVAVSTP
jgi:hypothetical protein